MRKYSESSSAVQVLNNIMNSNNNNNNNKVSNFSDLIQRVTSSCLLNPIGSNRHYSVNIQSEDSDSDSDYEQHKSNKNVVQETALAAPMEQIRKLLWKIGELGNGTHRGNSSSPQIINVKTYVAGKETYNFLT
ncbi:hypothetical protein Hanom_Chr01g00048301 [Helianthus anomalus]